ESVSDGEEDLLHLGNEPVTVDGADAIAVDLVKDVVVEVESWTATVTTSMLNWVVLSELQRCERVHF
ncbi:hypothetical protein PanWU01x14_335660, partial [Parasponia andersonii]